MMGQGAFRGANRMCRQCDKTCKQFENVTVIKCNFMVLPQRKKVIDPPPCEKAQNGSLEAVKWPIIEKTIYPTYP